MPAALMRVLRDTRSACDIACLQLHPRISVNGFRHKAINPFTSLLRRSVETNFV